MRRLQFGQTERSVDLSTWRQQFRTVGELQEGICRCSFELPAGRHHLYRCLPGEGKTLLALSIVKALTTGKAFLGRADFAVPKVMSVLYLIPEVGAGHFECDVRSSASRTILNLFLCRTISEGATLFSMIRWCLEAVRRMRPVIFLDTVFRFNEAEDENAAAQNKVLVNQLLELRHAGAASIVGLHHSTKAMRKEGMAWRLSFEGQAIWRRCAMPSTA